jgi:hypothetical protein
LLFNNNRGIVVLFFPIQEGGGGKFERKIVQSFAGHGPVDVESISNLVALNFLKSILCRFSYFVYRIFFFTLLELVYYFALLKASRLFFFKLNIDCVRCFCLQQPAIGDLSEK